MGQSRLRDKIRPQAERAAGILSFFRLSIGFQWAVSAMQRFSLSVVRAGILTPEKFYQRGTLENAMRNAFQHNGWEKNLASPQYLVHDPPRHPHHMVFIVLGGHSPVSPKSRQNTLHSATKSSWTRSTKLAIASSPSIKTKLKQPSRRRRSSMAARACVLTCCHSSSNGPMTSIAR